MKDLVRTARRVLVPITKRRRRSKVAPTLESKSRWRVREILHAGAGPSLGTRDALVPSLLATTCGGRTRFSPALIDHPRRREVEAHEAVHRAQFANFGRRPLGTREELEAEARAGAAARLRGQSPEPVLAAPPSMTLAYSGDEPSWKAGRSPPWTEHQLQTWLERDLADARSLMDQGHHRARWQLELEYAKQRFRLGMQLLRLWRADLDRPRPGSLADFVFFNTEHYRSAWNLLDAALQRRKSEATRMAVKCAGDPACARATERDLAQVHARDPYEARLDTVDPADQAYADQMAAAIVHGQGSAPPIEPAPAPELEVSEATEPGHEPVKRARPRRRPAKHGIEMEPVEVHGARVPVSVLVGSHELSERDIVGIVNRILYDLGIATRVTSLSQTNFPTGGNTGVHPFRQVSAKRVVGVIRAGKVGESAWVQINVMFERSGFHRISYRGYDHLGRSRSGVVRYDPEFRRWR